ncbi:hypothetical protein ACQKWADRAFT_290503 [Trichoderma austrokoningii]
MSNTGASQRASEITSAMLNVPGYADDSMLFMMRYGALAKETLRKADWDEFQLRTTAMNAHWFKTTSHQSAAASGDDSVTDVVGSRGTAVAAGSTAATGDAVDPVVEPDEAAELKARTLELIQDFPRLVRDFDRFVECTRIMAARYNKR